MLNALVIPDFNIIRHRSTVLKGVEQNVESVWPGLYISTHTTDGFINASISMTANENTY